MAPPTAGATKLRPRVPPTGHILKSIPQAIMLPILINEELSLRAQPRPTAPQPHWLALSQRGGYRIRFQGYQGLTIVEGWVCVVGEPKLPRWQDSFQGNPMERSLERTVSTHLPRPPSPTPVDRLGLGAPLRLGSAWTTFWPPPGCACLGLPANSCLPSGRLGGPLWRCGCGGRKSPPPPDPQATDTSPRAGLILSGHPLCVLQLTLQLEPCPRGHQLRGPPVALRGSDLSFFQLCGL